MIQADDIHKSYGGRSLFDGLSFTVNAGERIGLVGRNGSGKTTLFRMIMGEEHPDSGSLVVPSGYSIGRLSQHLNFTCSTVLDEGRMSLRPSEDFRDETYKVKTILHGLGFSDQDFERPPSELSGGFQVRLSLAKVLINEPNLLLLDEPTNYLDIVSIRWLSRFLRGWSRELILITHDREFMDGVTTHTMGIHRARIRKTAGPTTKLYDQIILEEEVHERTRLNEEKKRKDVEQFINRFRAQANKAKAVQSRIKALQKKERLEKLGNIKTLDFCFRSAPFTGKQLAEIEELSFGFDSSAALISGLNLKIAKKDRIAVIGKNGRGKTTLLNLLAGEIAPSSGCVSLHPQARLAYFGQTNIDRLNSEKTVEQEIMDSHPDIGRGEARGICGLMMFEGDDALKKISVLSGGERSRVLLGKLLVGSANLLLLDEPTNHLDMESIDSLIEAIEAFEGAVVIVTHSELMLHALAERLIVFDRGGISVFDGTYDDFLEKVGWEDEPGETVRSAAAQDRAPGGQRKDMRRLKAALIDERSRTLGPLQSGISAIEERITNLEGVAERSTKELLEASRTGDAEAIRALSMAIRDANDEIERLFSELESKTEEFDDKTRMFDVRLRELETQ